MHRLFLDANVLFSAAYSTRGKVARLWLLRDALLLTSIGAVEEAHRNLSAAGRSGDLGRLLSALIVVDDAVLEDDPLEVAALPEKDRYLLRSSIASGSTHLLTGDKAHFQSLFGKSVRGVRIMTPGDYLRAIDAGNFN